jgi:uncharacterized protein
MGLVSASLLLAVGVQLLCQTLKMTIYSIRDRRFSFGYFVSAGGYPSSHSAFVTSFAVATGMKSGFESDVFAVASVFAVIVIYDAYRLRGAVEKHAKMLNKLTRQFKLEGYEELSEMIGHSLPEIAAGILTGGLLAWAAVALTGL